MGRNLVQTRRSERNAARKKKKMDLGLDQWLRHSVCLGMSQEKKNLKESLSVQKKKTARAFEKKRRQRDRQQVEAK